MENYSRIVDYIERTNLSAEALLCALVDWNGVSIIGDDFIENQRGNFILPPAEPGRHL